MKFWLNALILILIYSCGHDKHLSPRTIVLSSVKIEDVIQKQKAKCAPISGETCPSGIGRIFTRDRSDDKKYQLCTGILIDANNMVTSSHCVSSQTDCENSVISIYMGYGLEYRTCKKFIFGEENNAHQGINNLDYAILEIHKIEGWTKLNYQKDINPQVGDEFSAWVIDHEDLYNFRISEINCELSQSDLSMELIRCPVISGNSGSPLFNRFLDLVGIIWGGTAGEEITEETELNKRRSMPFKAYATPIKYILPYLR